MDFAEAGKLCAGREHVVYFYCEAIYGGAGRPTVARLNASFYLRLTNEELLTKCGLCEDVPDAESNLMSLGYPCPNPDAFGIVSARLPDRVIRGDRPTVIG
jgi:hypothetical protein